MKKVSANADSVMVWSASEFKSAFGFETGTLMGNGFIGFMNGDGKANSQHINGATYLYGNIYAVFQGKVTGNTATRINYIVVIS